MSYLYHIIYQIFELNRRGFRKNSTAIDFLLRLSYHTAMITAERLTRGPQPPQEKAKRPEDQDIRQVLEQRINTAIRRAQEQLMVLQETGPGGNGLLTVASHQHPTIELFTVSGDKSYANLEGWLVENARLQELGLAVMRDHGLDTSQGESYFTDKPLGVYNTGTNTSAQVLAFPSQNNPSLSFVRTTKYYTNSGQTFGLSWRVEVDPHQN